MEHRREIILATGNNHKREELQQILPGIHLILPQDRGLVLDYEETGETFEANAYGKAFHLFQQDGNTPVLADDSGLCVPALRGEPGVYSARYGSQPGKPNLSSAERNRYLLEMMKDKEDRRAFFVCSMVLILGEYRFFTIQETVHGILTSQPSGTGGFGYDPLFYLPDRDKTMAELTAEEKNRISHRGRAGVRLNRLIQDSLTSSHPN